MADGTPIVQFTSPTTFLWEPNWQMPNAILRLQIIDAVGRAVRVALRSAVSAPAVGDPLTRAIELYQTQPSWRYEALRQLATAANHDPQAAQAVLVIRLARDEPELAPSPFLWDRRSGTRDSFDVRARTVVDTMIGYITRFQRRG